MLSIGCERGSTGSHDLAILLGMSKQATKKRGPKAPKGGFIEAYQELLAPEDIIEAGRRLGVIERQRKVDLPALVKATVLALGPMPGAQTSAYTNYLSLVDEDIVPASFYERFTSTFADLMCEVAWHAVEKVRTVYRDDGRTSELQTLLDHFEDVQAADSTCKILHQFARAWAPSTSRKRPAGMKVHTVISLRDHLPVSATISSQRVHDNRGLDETVLKPGTLTLFDLGYVDTARFVRMAHAGAHFLTRLKLSHDPVITRVHKGKGSRIAARGLRVNDALEQGHLKPHAGEIDLDVQLEAGGTEAVVRAVATTVDGELHWYLTTVGRDVLTPEDVSEAYRLRWDIGLVFKQLKSGAGLASIRAWRPSAVRALVYAQVVALCLVRLLELSVEKKYGPQASAQLALLLTFVRMIPLLFTAEHLDAGETLEDLEDKILRVAARVSKSRNHRRDLEKAKRRRTLGR